MTAFDRERRRLAAQHDNHEINAREYATRIRWIDAAEERTLEAAAKAAQAALDAHRLRVERERELRAVKRKLQQQLERSLQREPSLC